MDRNETRSRFSYCGSAHHDTPYCGHLFSGSVLAFVLKHAHHLEKERSECHAGSCQSRRCSSSRDYSGLAVTAAIDGNLKYRLPNVRLHVKIVICQNPTGKEDIPEQLLSLVLDTCGGELSPIKSRTRLEAYTFLLTHRHEVVRAAACVMIASVFCLQVGLSARALFFGITPVLQMANFTNRDVCELTRACINVALEVS